MLLLEGRTDPGIEIQLTYNDICQSKWQYQIL
ncbi:MAG: hypothetical protein ACI9Z3_001878 [Roseivirga sp.]|jgi:hypothetical protein